MAMWPVHHPVIPLTVCMVCLQNVAVHFIDEHASAVETEACHNYNVKLLVVFLAKHGLQSQQRKGTARVNNRAAVITQQELAKSF